MVLNAAFNNVSDILWQSVLLQILIVDIKWEKGEISVLFHSYQEIPFKYDVVYLFLLLWKE